MRTIRFIAMTGMLRCSDACLKRHCKRQSAVRRINLVSLAVVVDNIPVQRQQPIVRRIIHWPVGRERGDRPDDRTGDQTRQMRSRDVLNLISIVISGLLVGLAARFFYPGTVEMGLGRTILLGIGGALVAGLAASLARQDRNGGINRAGCLASILGAMLLIFIGRNL